MAKRIPCRALTGLSCTVSLLTALGADAAEMVRFQRGSARVGDVVRQALECELQAEVVISQAGQTIDSSRQGLQRRQDRLLEILQLDGPRTSRGRIRYPVAAKTATLEGHDPQSIDEPIAGKTYLVSRGGDNELRITDPAGQPPPPEELALLEAGLQGFGLPNPLADFLDGRQLRVGQTVELPAEVAAELLGIAPSVGEVQRFSMRLTGTRQVDEVRCAIFQTLLRTAQQEDMNVTLLMRGQLTIQVSTCRTVEMTMEGPVAISEARGPAQGRFLVSTQGTLHVAVQTRYHSRR
jgi:hypothetical protein